LAFDTKSGFSLDRMAHHAGQKHCADDQPVTRDHGHHQPERQFAGKTHDDEDRDKQELVGDRIEIGAEAGRLVPAARDEAVDAIGNAGDEETGEGPPPKRLQHGQHHRGHEQQPHDRDHVGKGHRMSRRGVFGK